MQRLCKNLYEQRVVHVILSSVAFLFLQGCITPPTREQVQATVDVLTPEHFKSTATLRDDSLDTTAKIDTSEGFRERRGLLGIVWDDNFLRGIIDKKSGHTTVQLYQIIRYQGPRWRFYELVNYETPTGPIQRPLTLISRDVDCTGSRYGGCTYTEHVAFSVQEDFLRMLAGRYTPGQLAAWRFKFIAKADEDLNTFLFPAEVVGFLAAIDGYRASKSLSPASLVESVPAVGQYNPNYSVGPHSKTVEDMVRGSSCTSKPIASVKMQGPGYYNYQVKCDSGDILIFRCEMGGCRELR